MRIGPIDLQKEILIIAEIGNNHEGSLAAAEEMIGLAAKAGAGAVKFQTIVPEKLISANEKQRIEQLRRFQLSYADFEKLSRAAACEKVLFLSFFLMKGQEISFTISYWRANERCDSSGF